MAIKDLYEKKKILFIKDKLIDLNPNIKTLVRVRDEKRKYKIIGEMSVSPINRA